MWRGESMEAGLPTPAEEPRVRLGPPDRNGPRLSRLPTAHARRWVSIYEREMDPPALRVCVTQPAYVRVCALAGKDMRNEVGGILVGRWRKDRKSGDPFIVVEGALPARHTRHGSAFLTFTQDTIVEMHAEQEARYPRKQIVGWFHTHPRMGVFLSEYDTWLHQHFFPEPWQVALVIEPHSAAGGFFIRTADGALDPQHYSGFWELLGNRPRSLVYWRNLELLPDEGEGRGG
jgi:proteasome lid subunit RPN8/RPN11